jgi:hypothetical protein
MRARLGTALPRKLRDHGGAAQIYLSEFDCVNAYWVVPGGPCVRTTKRSKMSAPDTARSMPALTATLTGRGYCARCAGVPHGRGRLAPPCCCGDVGDQYPRGRGKPAHMDRRGDHSRRPCRGLSDVPEPAREHSHRVRRDDEPHDAAGPGSKRPRGPSQRAGASRSRPDDPARR